MDETTQRLIERTRQRREMLNEKLGKTPDPAPRKRTIPFSENTTHNIPDDDDSPKRHCSRQHEVSIKSDTPAITGVKSRLAVLKDTRADWSDVSDGETSVPVPVPRKSLSSPPPREPEPVSSSTRGNRFAKLASNINSWEDDLSHPTISKEEEKKPRWQPPKAPVTENTSHHKSRAPEPPKLVVPPSPKKTHAPPPPPMPSAITKHSPCKPVASMQSPRKTPVSTTYKTPGSPAKPVVTQTMSSPLRTPQQARSAQDTDQIPVNAKGLNESPSDQTDDEPTAKPVSERFAKWAKKSDTTPKVGDPTQTPVSARMANWQQKVSNPPKSTPVVSASKVKPLPKQICTPVTQSAFKSKSPLKNNNTTASDSPQEGMTVHKTTADDPASLPVSSRMATWQQKAAKPKRDEEPTAYPVLARMSAWEQMSSTNQVAHIKKVNPAPAPAPVKAAQPIALGSVLTSSSKLTQKPVSSPKSKGLTPSKSFVESIQERASQINHSPTCKSPPKVQSPAKVSCTMKSVQQRLMEQTHNSDKSHNLVDKIRQERMAELNVIQNRWKNGILNDKTDTETDVHVNQGIPPPPPPPVQSSPMKTVKSSPAKSQTGDQRDAIKARARADFDQKLAAMGFDVPADPESPVATFHFKRGEKKSGSSDEDRKQGQQVRSATVTNKPPPAPTPSSNQARPSSIYGLISKNKNGEPPAKPNTKFNDSFDSDSDDQIDDRPQPPLCETDDTEPTTESEDDCIEQSSAESECVQLRKKPVTEFYDDGDDVSLSAFVPASVRRESVLPHAGHRQSLTSEASYDSFEDISVVGRGDQGNREQRRPIDQATCSMTSVTSQSSADSQEQTYLDDTDDKADIDDLLDEAMDSDDSDRPVAAPRKRGGDKSSEEPTSPLIYSVSMYRSKRYNEKPPPAKMKIIRNSDYTDADVEEEEIEMPDYPPAPTSRKTLQERIKELQELVQQEQSIIMQTSNALNQCCSGNSAFVGSSEQVECNRLLLIACQKRQAYLTEIQRLKDTGQLEDMCGGPKGSLTISDIRLPLKKEFVTKIGTTQDTITYYFVLLIHNGPQLIFTQMLSTHDPMMRGSLDFPNLIKINGIGGNFKLDIEIFGMSVSKESTGKDKKKKTPKKSKSGLPLQSPGGPLAVRTTSFSLITSLTITMKSLDKSSFNLERLPYLSPLHGTIFMRLKCLMEASVEERGFLTMFEDVSGLGAWHRRWVVLSRNRLGYWKYPDDETRKEPIGVIDLKRCITDKVGLIPRDICARPNTFELVTVRQPRKGEQDTLTCKTYNTMTTVKVMLSADTKEERIVWCNKVNRALANIRTWHADAMRPIKSH
ncbi:hypothetical protein SNE40_007110 [Patella caerulea]|uniref:PH domain-containing protein n=1 Tax=Patella caerulea TaxID=87958 RepID=A0AAN8PUI5_PATCE